MKNKIILCVFLFLPWFTWASENSSQAGVDPILKVHFGRGITRGAIQAAAEKFQQDRGIDMHDVLTENIDEGLESDIFCGSHDEIWRLAANGFIQPINPSSTIRTETVMIGWDGMTFGSQSFAYPLAIEATVLVYNVDLLDTAPKSFEEIPLLNKRLLATKNVSAIAWDYTNPQLSWSILAAGGSPMFERGKSGVIDPVRNNISSKSAVTGAKLIKDFVDQNLLPQVVADNSVETLFTEGNVAAILVGPNSWAQLHDSGIAWGVAPIPKIKGKKATSVVNVWGCAIAKDTDAAIATDFIENYLMQDDTLISLFNARSGGVPTQKNAFHYFWKSDDIRGLYSIINDGKPIPASEAAERFWINLSEALKLIVNGSPIQKTLKEASKKTAALD